MKPGLKRKIKNNLDTFDTENILSTIHHPSSLSRVVHFTLMHIVEYLSLSYRYIIKIDELPFVT